MRKVNYKEKGITLIALVVTIIILLILAGVTLTTALSQNGLFQRAKIVVEKYKEAEADEVEKLGEVEKELDKIIDGETPPDPPKKPDPVEVTTENLKEFQGKYVDIGLDTNGNNKVDDWEIFYVNEGRIFLISADYVPVTKLEEWNIIGSGTTLGNAGLKKNGDKYRVDWDFTIVTQKDCFSMEENFLNLVMHDGYRLNDHKDYLNSKVVSQLLNKDAWNGLKSAASVEGQEYIDFSIGGPTLGMWCAAWNEAVSEDSNEFVKIEPVGDNTGYKVKANGNTNFVVNVEGTSGQLDKAMSQKLGEEYGTFFPHVEVFEACYGYWIASPSCSNFGSSRSGRMP